MIVDVHSHVYFDVFKDDFESVLADAQAVGVGVIVCNGLDLATNKKVLALAKKYSLIKAAFGLYPLEVAKLSQKEIGEVFSFVEANADACVAFGEVGLDGTDPESLPQQKVVLERFLKLAKKLGKPVILHSRKAELETIELVEKVNIKHAIFHCFSGKFSLVKRIEANNHFVSIPVNVLHASQFQKVAKEVSMKNLLMETDAPFLGPVRGERNVPKNLALSLQKIAELRDLNRDEVEKMLFMNAKKILSL